MQALDTVTHILTTDIVTATFSKPCRKLAVLMAAVAPKIYKKYVTINKKGEMVLYALYGLLKLALLYYQMCVKDLLSIVFVLNP
jgi:hypothetical protein